MRTRGELLVEKFANFVDFCIETLPLQKEQMKDMLLARQASAESLVFAIRTHLLPHQAIVVARDLHKLQRVQDHVAWSSCIAVLENADSATQDKFWRYLQLFCELCNFSESQ